MELLELCLENDLYEESSTVLKVPLDKLIAIEHVLLLGELHVVGDVLQDLGHEHEAALNVGRRLLLNNAHLVGRHDGRVDEAEEEDGADGPDVVLD